MVATGGLSGGISSTIAGGKFVDGFKQGLMTSGLNHLAHLTFEAINTVSFKSLDEIKEKYPRFYKVLTKLQDYVSGNKDIAKALVDNSGYSRSEIIDILNIDSIDNLPLKVSDIISVRMNGNGVETKSLWQGWGKTSADAPFKISITRWRVLVLEKLTNSTAINNYSFALAVTVLHEIVHYGRFVNGLDNQKYEYGHGFERDAFGGIINDNNLFNNSLNKHGWKF